MGGYLNPGNEKFGEALNSQIYVDKTGLIEYTNGSCTAIRNMCVSAGLDALASRWRPICWRPITAGGVIRGNYFMD